MILSAVKTEGKAKEMLNSELNVSYFENGSCSCECGETSSIEAYNSNHDLIGKVAVCDGCGDDDSSHDIIKKYV